MKFLSDPFPFFLNDNRKNILLILLVSVFVFLFLILYKPFESTHTVTRDLSWAVLCFGMLYFNIILLPKLLPSVFDPTEWNLLKYIIFCAWLFLFMSILFSIINYILFCGEMSYWFVLLKTSRETTLVGIIPLLVITILAKNELLKQNLADAVFANRNIHEIRTIREKEKKQDNNITLSTDTSETFTFKLTDLAYAAAVDNYSEIYHRDGEKLAVKLLRVTLKNVEQQLSNQYILRCHRSYLINIREIESISGNTNGYKLKIKGAEIEIPVSRTKGREIIDHIQQIRDILDIIR